MSIPTDADTLEQLYIDEHPPPEAVEPDRYEEAEAPECSERDLLVLDGWAYCPCGRSWPTEESR